MSREVNGVNTRRDVKSPKYLFNFQSASYSIRTRRSRNEDQPAENRAKEEHILTNGRRESNDKENKENNLNERTNGKLKEKKEKVEDKKTDSLKKNDIKKEITDEEEKEMEEKRGKYTL